MRWPSVTIATFMGAVVVLAVDLGLLREGFRDGNAIFYVLGIAPTANLVMIALIAEASRLGRTGKGRPFWTGFIFGGGMAITVTSSFVNLTFAEPAWIVLRGAWLVLGESLYKTVMQPGVDFLCISLVCTLPQVAFALMGGWLFRRFRLVIVQLQTPGEGTNTCDTSTIE